MAHTQPPHEESKLAAIVAAVRGLLASAAPACSSVKATRSPSVAPAARAGVEPLNKKVQRRASTSCEHSPLLQRKRAPSLYTHTYDSVTASVAYSSNASSDGTDTLCGFRKSLLRGEAQCLLSLASQMLLSNIIDFLPGFVGGVLTGHISQAMSSQYIAAKSLAGVFMMVTGFTVNIALGAAMDTLCAQAFGAGKLHEMGVFFQTGLLLFTALFVPVALVSYCCVDILVALGQRRDIALLARDLVLYMLPSLPFHAVNALLCKILQGQNIITPMVYAGLVGNAVHAVLIYGLMFHTRVGYAGSSLASSALVACYSVTLGVYFCRSTLYVREWPGWRLRDALRVVPEFLRLGGSGLLMFVFEYWGFAAAALLAGSLPHADVAISADSTYSSFRVLCALFYGTISVAGSVRVGNALGANDPERARAAAYLSVALTVACALLTSFAMLLLRHVYPFAYTSDTRVVALTAKLLLLTCPFQVFAGISAAVQGIFRGSGLQMLGARLNFVAYLALAMPVGVTLAYALDMGLVGLWLGLCAGFVVSGCYCLHWLRTADWHDMALAAQRRTREPGELSPPDVTSCLC